MMLEQLPDYVSRGGGFRYGWIALWGALFTMTSHLPYAHVQ